MEFKLQPKHRLMIAIGLSFSFFVSELAMAFKTKSIALIADAFHYLSDLIGFIVALSAQIISERSYSPQGLTFGWQRVRLLGAFFNGVFLLALGVTIFLQSIERFMTIEPIEEPKLVLIMGCVGLALNIISAAFLHEHDHGHDHHGHAHPTASSDDNSETAVETGSAEMATHLHPHAEHRHMAVQNKSPGRDLNMLGAMIHVLGDAANNLGVIIAALVIWQTHYHARFYADPGVSMGISFIILLTALPLVQRSGKILLQSPPAGVNIKDVQHDIEAIPGVESVHELHIWRLDQEKAIASAHIVVSDRNLSNFMGTARTVGECLHAYGVHSATLQPELPAGQSTEVSPDRHSANHNNGGGGDDANAQSRTTAVSSIIRRRRVEAGACQIPCGARCENLMCCTSL